MNNYTDITVLESCMYVVCDIYYSTHKNYIKLL